VPLKWHYPVGLLHDLYSGDEPTHAAGRGARTKNDAEAEAREGSDTQEDFSALEEAERGPWKLVVHFSDWPHDQLVKLDEDGKVLEDAFKNSVKESSFLRHGTGKIVMSLSYQDSTQLWRGVEEQDLKLYNAVNNKLLSPPGESIRHVPLRIYLPSEPTTATSTIEEDAPAAGHLKVVQALVEPTLPNKQPQTLGTALNTILPTVFLSRRNAILAMAVLHGAVVPLTAVLEELAKAASYADGFLHVVVVMMG